MSSQQRQSIRVGGASGFWGESDMAVPQLLAAGNVDYLVFDYLAEITMSIMARARATDPAKGYATDFVTAALKPHLRKIAEAGVKVISNAGGVNPQACGAAVRELVKASGLDLSVAVITGDDLIDRLSDFADCTAMDTGAAFPEPAKVASANAYLGAFPIAEALARGADIVITGRCVDSAVTLGACIHAFGWTRDDYDRLAGGSLAGHIIECGPQSTGGNFTDWQSIADVETIGYPIAEIRADGSFDLTKADGTGGAVTTATVGEQMLYEIGDPQAYMLPDVICDFSAVTLAQTAPTRVRVAGARGRPASDTYKVSLTWSDGWRAGALWFFIGEDAAAKARAFGNAGIGRARAKLRAMNVPDFDDTLVEILGDESHYGDFARPQNAREVVLKVAVKHQDPRAAGLLLKEVTGLALSAPPGLTLFSGGRPKPSPVVRLFSFLADKQKLPIDLDLDGTHNALGAESGRAFDRAALPRPAPPSLPTSSERLIEVPLIRLAQARSGDKGDNANIGVLPRRPEYAAWIWQALTEQVVAERFAHFLKGQVERFYLPGTGSINFLLHHALGGGGVASLRNDPQGKSYAQVLLQTPVAIPASLVEAF
ncbi:MAG: acyclic terpene utilization AtuA family protein [Xanthobacteraceae bacterium]